MKPFPLVTRKKKSVNLFFFFPQNIPLKASSLSLTDIKVLQHSVYLL